MLWFFGFFIFGAAFTTMRVALSMVIIPPRSSPGGVLQTLRLWGSICACSDKGGRRGFSLVAVEEGDYLKRSIRPFGHSDFGIDLGHLSLKL